MFFVKHGAITKDKKEFVFNFKRGSEVGFLSIKNNQVLNLLNLSWYLQKNTCKSVGRLLKVH